MQVHGSEGDEGEHEAVPTQQVTMARTEPVDAGLRATARTEGRNERLHPMKGNVDRASAEQIVDEVLRAISRWAFIDREAASECIETAILNTQGVWVTLR